MLRGGAFKEQKLGPFLWAGRGTTTTLYRSNISSALPPRKKCKVQVVRIELFPRARPATLSHSIRTPPNLPALMEVKKFCRAVRSKRKNTQTQTSAVLVSWEQLTSCAKLCSAGQAAEFGSGMFNSSNCRLTCTARNMQVAQFTPII